MKNPLAYDSVRGCDRCPALGQDHVPSWGNPSARLMVIGQNPGRQEVEQGIPFFQHAPSGELLGYMLDNIGLAREDIYIANAVKCGTHSNRAPHAEEVASCWNEWLHDEIRLVNPDVILLLGKIAFDAVVQGRKKFEHNIHFSNKKYTFVASWHPSYCLRTDNLLEFINNVGETVAACLIETEAQSE